MRRRQQSFVTSVHTYSGGGGEGVGSGGGGIRGDVSTRCSSPVWTSSRSREPFLSLECRGRSVSGGETHLLSAAAV